MNQGSRLICMFLVVIALFFTPILLAQTPLEELGELLYFDRSLSQPDGQACSDCHLPSAFFVDPDQEFPVSQGVLPKNRWGNRNSPMSAYAFLSPDFHYDPIESLYVGGQFWDGRAANVEEQAKGPFLNPLEMNNPNKRTVIEDILRGPYIDLFVEVFGHDRKYIQTHIDEAYDFVANAIGAFERTELFAPFDSKYDYYLQGHNVLTEMELGGLALFEDKGMCDECHISQPGPNGEPPLFTDFTYDNLGVPKNPNNPFYSLPAHFNPYGHDWVDYGLGGVLGIEEEMGKHKVMTLRNIAMTAPYLHNGFFTSLREVVEFYNSRDLGGFPPPEVPVNVNTDELGDLGLTSAEIDSIVAFMETLTDGYIPTFSNKNVKSAYLSDKFTLGSNYPNPFNPSTKIDFSLASPAIVRLTIFNILGEEITSLANGNYDAGTHSVIWNGTNKTGEPAASGVYFYKLVSNDYEETKKMILSR